MNPSSVNLQNNIGLAYLLSRRYAEAEQTFERMISLWPDYSLSYYNLARTYLIWEGDKEKAIEIYEMALKNLDSRFEKDILCRIATTKGEYNDALQHLVLAGSIFYYLEKASLYDFLGNDSQKFLVADSAKSVLEARIRSEPDTEANAFYHYRLGVAYAFLGLKEEAIRTVLKADELWPISKEPVRGIWWREALPKIYVLVGDYDSAIDQIEYLLSIPSYMTVAKLRTEPDWAPLRDHPRFQKLINEGGYSEK